MQLYKIQLKAPIFGDFLDAATIQERPFFGACILMQRSIDSHTPFNKTEKTFQSKSAAINFFKIITDFKSLRILKIFTKFIKLQMTIFEKNRKFGKFNMSKSFEIGKFYAVD